MLKSIFSRDSQEGQSGKVQAVWNGAILAESDETRIVEGNHYFPPESINEEFFKKNSHNTVCPWKGVASYYDVEVDGQVNKSAAWYYPEASPAAEHIRGYVAFWHGVKVRPAPE
ncbi:MAG: DUF427 domain-containing protein [Anaerolineales bacterium]|nr:DUF427 domain-containing protein [Anaerolineales bacterium]